MVGIFGARNKSTPPKSRGPRPSTDTDIDISASPPPPYRESSHAAQVYATETTTTTTHVVTTTTQTTTHFFSLPLWRRRTRPSSDINRQSMPDPLPGDLGLFHAPSHPIVLFRDKDLPPTPSSLIEQNHFHDPRTSTSLVLSPDPVINPPKQQIVMSPSRNSSQLFITPPPKLSTTPSSHHSPANPTATLARAALGLGLPPVILNNPSAASSSSDLNSITFVTPPTPASPTDSRPRAPTIRRAKSYQKFSESRFSDPSLSSELMDRRRNRGLSLGPLHFGLDSKGKEKQKDPEPEPRPSMARTLTRKASFWSRKRTDSSTTNTPTPIIVPLPQERPAHPSLPSLQPVSPFYIDTKIPTSSLTPDYSNPPRPPELRRRHSERAPSSTRDGPLPSSDSLDSSNQEQSLKRRRSRRPPTADGLEGPRPTSSYIPESVPFVPPAPSRHPMPNGSTPKSATYPSSNSGTARPRAQTNPPLLHRLSVNLFGSPSSASSSVNVTGDGFTESPCASVTNSARPSFSRPSVEIPKPRQEEESPEVYLERLLEAVSKAEVATVLASSADDFHAKALRAYIARFDFSSDPLDVALRRLLMDVGLPRETQQIDRVMEAFAARYTQCHQSLFTSDDHPYILAFSLIMLHTDAFNKSNKRKMTKADYIKNTRLTGVYSEVLDCFYDNIVFAPFIFIEDPLDVNGQRGLIPEGTPTRRLSSLNAPSPGGLHSSSPTLLVKSSKVDPYYLITRNLLDDLRVNVQIHVPLVSPYHYQGTVGAWDEEELVKAFALAGVVGVCNTDPRNHPSPWYSLGVGGGPSPVTMTNLHSSVSNTNGDVFTLRVTKVGVLSRKDDILEGGKKAMNRKWKDWSVLLTGSQLLLYRDPAFAATIKAQANTVRGDMSLARSFVPKPEELLSVKDSIAVYDKSYTKYPNTLRLVMLDGRQLLLQAYDEREMNEWISRINYASAFKTAGVRMRSLGMSGKDIELTGKAAAASHIRDMQQRARIASTPPIRNWDGRASAEHDRSKRVAFVPPLIIPRSSASRQRTGSIDSALDGMDEPLTPPMENASRLLKATFDQVKQELARDRWRSADDGSPRSFHHRPRAHSFDSATHSPTSPTFKLEDAETAPSLSSRSRIIRSKVRDLESKIALAQIQLDSDMRFVRNIAVLTPFQRATRERLQVSVQNIAKRIMLVRLDMEKLVCHRDVLSKDLVAEEREWHRTNKMALKAATATLQSHREKTQVPRMTLSMYMDDSEQTITSPTPQAIMTPPPSSPSGSIGVRRSDGMSNSSHGPESSVAESFHSALDYIGADWGTSVTEEGRISSMGLFGTSQQDGLLPVASPESRRSTNSLPYPDSPERSFSSPSKGQQGQQRQSVTGESSMESGMLTPVDDLQSSLTHEKYYTAPETPEEQAEEWDKTRAAKRVSLVRLPTDLKLSVFLGKHGRNAEQGVSEDSPGPGVTRARSSLGVRSARSFSTTSGRMERSLVAESAVSGEKTHGDG